MRRTFIVMLGVISSLLLFAGEKVTVEFRLAETAPAEGLTKHNMPGSKESFFVHKKVLMSNNDIETAVVDQWQGKPVVRLKLTTEGAKKFARITTNYTKKRLAILIDGKIVAAPLINAPILQGVAIINGDFTIKEAERIAAGITTKQKVDE